MELENLIAVVTGGSKGIGKEIAVRLAKEGATVAFCHYDRDDRYASKVLDQIKKYGDGFFEKINIALAAEVEYFIQKVANTFERIDILVNNAGILVRKPFLEHHVEEWKSVLETNLFGSFYCGQAAGRLMAKNKNGRIINIGSRAYFGDPDLVAYSVSKSGIIALTKCMAMALGSFNIRVNCIVPGAIETEMLSHLAPDFREKRVSASPLKRIGKPKDIADGIVFLCSEKSDFITGEILHITGGVYG